MKKLIYEKHQRDYTVLTASIMTEEVFSKSFEKKTNYQMNPFFILVEEGIFYHFVDVSDYIGVSEAYFQKNDINSFKIFIEENNKKLFKAEKFLTSDHNDPAESIKTLHKYMRELFAIVMVSAYAPNFLKNLDKEIIKLCLEVRELYESIHRDGITLERKLLNLIEKEKNIEKNSLEYLTKKEFNIFLITGNLPNDYMERKKFFLCRCSKERIENISIDNADEILNEIDETRNLKYKTKQIKGNVACPGKVTGKVRIIRLIKEANNFQNGEVLVTSMTDPRYLPAMKKAAAFVTDEGGITCHAAIVSREMSKPCIIGTKIATQVLKDGDRVEVDADNGIVKIIK